MSKLNERTQDPVELYQRFRDAIQAGMRVSAPGIIQTVNYSACTVTVQLAIREKLNFNGNLEWTEIPLLLDVPFFVYSGGGYCLTLPIQSGDDCLVVFGDTCMDAWWQSGGVQNQIERRRHDLSDGFAIVGFRSQPQVVSGYSPGTAQLRNASGSAYIEIAGESINIVSSNTTIDGRSFRGHTHGGVEPGGGKTGGVT
jgi:hypothetical protein